MCTAFSLMVTVNYSSHQCQHAAGLASGTTHPVLSTSNGVAPEAQRLKMSSISPLFSNHAQAGPGGEDAAMAPSEAGLGVGPSKILPVGATPNTDVRNRLQREGGGVLVFFFSMIRVPESPRIFFTETTGRSSRPKWL